MTSQPAPAPYFPLRPTAAAAQIACGSQPLLPPHVRDELKRAADTPISPTDQNARIRAINKVIERAKQRYPTLFMPD